MLLAPPRVLGLDGRDVGIARLRRHELLAYAHGAGRIFDVYHRPLILRVDLDRGVRGRGRRAADQERHGDPEPLHLFCNVHHFVERGRDETGQSDEARPLALGGLEDFVAGDHHAEIDDLEVVTLQDDADNVLADVVHVALHGGHHYLAVRSRAAALAALDIRHEHRDRLLHHTRGLDHLREKHLARAEQIADDVHSVHERPFDHIERTRGLQSRLLGVLEYELIYALDERVLEALGDGELA